MNVFQKTTTVKFTTETGDQIAINVPSDWSHIENMTDERLAELSAAFDLVADPDNWKNPIDAIIRPDQVGDVVEAIDWYTGSVAVVEVLPDTDQERVRVTAEGYYLTIGA